MSIDGMGDGVIDDSYVARPHEHVWRTDINDYGHPEVRCDYCGATKPPAALVAHEQASLAREMAIAHLRRTKPTEALYYMGCHVDETWPADALLAIVHESAARARREQESHLRSLNMMSSLRRGL